MSELRSCIWDLIKIANPETSDEVLEGLVGGIMLGNLRLIYEDGKTSFSITQKGIAYVESMPHCNSTPTPTEVSS